MAKDLANNQKTKLGGAKKPYMDLGGHLDYIESLLEQGAGIGGGGQIIDLNEQIDPNDGTKITQEGYDLIQQAYENNTLLGISFVMFDTIEAVCMFDYVSLDIETMTNTYCFKFEAGETIIFKIKSDLTIVQSAQSSIAVYSQFTDLWYEGDYVSAIMCNETIYKIPYTLIYSRKDEYQNERLQFKNDTYDKTIYNIPTLPSDASTKNYALNSVKGTLTWQAAGGGGGKSVPPTLNLFDFGAGVRTTITEEEYNNLKNGLYNQVVYAISVDNFFPACSPSKLFDMNGAYYFTQFKIVANADGTTSYSSLVARSITIGEKNASKEYPITIQEMIEIPFGGGGGSSSFNIVQINDFHAGDHNQQGFIMPTENMVLFTDGSNTSLIGYKNVQDGVTSYVCYEWNTVSESGWRKYKYFSYRITEITTGYHIEEVDLSEVLQTDFEFLPHYSSSDNGKILSIVGGKPEWASIPAPTITFED